MKRLKGFFEFALQSDGFGFLVTGEILSPGLEEGEAKRRLVEEWLLHFAITSPIRQDGMQCVEMRPLPAKPPDAMKLPKGAGRILIWKSVEE